MGSKKNKKYRENVAAFVVNDDGLILACHRSDRRGAWQLPQGGVDKGETPEDTLFRELKEEIGTDQIEIIDTLPQTIYYEWPKRVQKRKGYRGQEQFYFLVKLKPGAEIVLDSYKNPEFDAVEWCSPNDFLNRIDGFKKDAYSKALGQFMMRNAGVLS